MPFLDKLLLKNPLLRWLSLGQSPFSVRAGTLFNDRIADEKMEKSTGREDFVARILEVKKNNPEAVPGEAVIGYIMTILLAGSDTVSIALRSVVYHLSKTPSLQRKLQDEIEAAKIGFPVSWKNAQTLPYLDAVIREALRVHPPTSILLERVVSRDGLALPDGRQLMPGTIVSMSGWAIKQNKEVFGPDADAFNPDRWLRGVDETEEQFHQRDKAMKRADIAFGHGSRSCMGKPIAQLEMYKIVPTLFGLFDVRDVIPLPFVRLIFAQIRLASPQKPWQYVSYFVTAQHDMDVILSWRECLDISLLKGPKI